MTDDQIIVMTQPPEGPVCDFCSYADVHWSYPCRDHAQKTEHATALVLSTDESPRVDHQIIDGFSHGGWAACNVCHGLIERGDRERLAKRSAKRQVRKLASQRPPVIWPLGDAIAHIRRLHDQFWENREGEPVYHEHRPGPGAKDPTR